MNDQKQSLARRRFLRQAGAAGIGVAGLSLLGGKAEAAHGPSLNGLIIEAATTAEALATTMYYNIIANTIYTSGLASNANDQAYLVAGLEQEADHYALLVTSGGKAAATTFYFPTGMFTDAQTTVNTLVTLEDAFISAYIIGVRDLSSASLRVLASQILGVESEHRAFGRVIAADLGLTAVTGLSGVAEDVNGPSSAANNLSYERAFLTQIGQAFTALAPFLTPGTAGFSSTPYTLPAVTINADGSGTVARPSGVASVTLANNLP